MRPPTATELKATSILRLPLDEASAKVREGPPKDNEDDYGWPVWAGVIPLEMTWGEPCRTRDSGPDSRRRYGGEPPARR